MGCDQCGAGIRKKEGWRGSPGKKGVKETSRVREGNGQVEEAGQ